MNKVYVLKSLKDGNLYIGCTSNLDKRLEAHKKGKVFSTKSRLPIELIFAESYADKFEAYRMERFYKTAKGKKVIKTKIDPCGIV